MMGQVATHDVINKLAGICCSPVFLEYGSGCTLATKT